MGRLGGGGGDIPICSPGAKVSRPSKLFYTVFKTNTHTKKTYLPTSTLFIHDTCLHITEICISVSSNLCLFLCLSVCLLFSSFSLGLRHACSNRVLAPVCLNRDPVLLITISAAFGYWILDPFSRSKLCVPLLVTCTRLFETWASTAYKCSVWLLNLRPFLQV